VRKRAVAAYFSSPRAKGIDPRANWPATATARGAAATGSRWPTGWPWPVPPALRSSSGTAQVPPTDARPCLNTNPFPW